MEATEQSQAQKVGKVIIETFSYYTRVLSSAYGYVGKLYKTHSSSIPISIKTGLSLVKKSEKKIMEALFVAGTLYNFKQSSLSMTIGAAHGFLASSSFVPKFFRMESFHSSDILDNKPEEGYVSAKVMTALALANYQFGDNFLEDAAIGYTAGLLLGNRVWHMSDQVAGGVIDTIKKLFNRVKELLPLVSFDAGIAIPDSSEPMPLSQSLGRALIEISSYFTKVTEVSFYYIKQNLVEKASSEPESLVGRVVNKARSNEKTLMEGLFFLAASYNVYQSPLISTVGAVHGWMLSRGKVPKFFQIPSLSKEGYVATKIMVSLAFINAYLGKNSIEDGLFGYTTGLLLGNHACRLFSPPDTARVDVVGERKDSAEDTIAESV